MVGAGAPLRVSASSSLGFDDVVWLRFTEGRGTGVQTAAVWLWRLLERGVVDVGLAPVGAEMLVGWATGASSDLSPLLPAICLPDLGLASVAKLARFYLPLDGFAGSAGGRLSDGLLSALLLTSVPRVGGGRGCY
jgi:hypothetical protein